MYKILLSFSALLLLTLACNSNNGTDSEDSINLLLASILQKGQCTSLPQTIQSGSSTYSCSAAGLSLTCTISSPSITIVYTYASASRAAQGVFYDPGFTTNPMFASRATSIKGSGTTNFLVTYSFDNNDRIASGVFTSSGTTGTYTFSNYDSNGFPQQVSGLATGTITYAYGHGGTRPGQYTGTVGGKSNDYQFDARGYPTYSQVGTTTSSSSTSGTVQICD